MLKTRKLEIYLRAVSKEPSDDRGEHCEEEEADHDRRADLVETRRKNLLLKRAFPTTDYLLQLALLQKNTRI